MIYTDNLIPLSTLWKLRSTNMEKDRANMNFSIDDETLLVIEDISRLWSHNICFTTSFDSSRELLLQLMNYWFPLPYWYDTIFSQHERDQNKYFHPRKFHPISQWNWQMIVLRWRDLHKTTAMQLIGNTFISLFLDITIEDACFSENDMGYKMIQNFIKRFQLSQQDFILRSYLEHPRTDILVPLSRRYIL